MKVLKYRLMTEVNHGTEEQPKIQQIFSDVSLGWSEANEEIAKREAYNGEYTIEDVPDDRPLLHKGLQRLYVRLDRAFIFI